MPQPTHLLSSTNATSSWRERVPSPDGIRRVSLLGLAGEAGAARPVLGIAVEGDDAAWNAHHGCAPGKANMTLPGLGVPGLGESRAAIAARYGIEVPQTSRINIVHQTYEGETLILQQLQFLLDGDTITAVALTESRM